ncbi:hypothetical protein PoB_000366400 [Plakobranchus ocellatus]|uniref:Uncharacterized protein n=1 Tax=Plakobranchus ocellatus TaxID=259542 RepID=A0AAV3Y2H6_9GAST|nr:hypothetical protein PoB_000366400 [Plakobranchus ocellatus]
MYQCMESSCLSHNVVFVSCAIVAQLVETRVPAYLGVYTSCNCGTASGDQGTGIFIPRAIVAQLVETRVPAYLRVYTSCNCGTASGDQGTGIFRCLYLVQLWHS